MCRVVAYLGTPLPLDVLLYRSDSSLARQSYAPRMMGARLNLAGCGVAYWDSLAPEPELPLLYKDTVLPGYNENLRRLSRKGRAEAAVAHIRGADYTGTSPVLVSHSNLHPFHYEGVRTVLAHNGGLNRFAEMRFSLLDYIDSDVATHIEGTTDSEWLYAVFLSQLSDPGSPATAEELGEAVVRTLEIVRTVRDRHGIDLASGVNLFISDGRHIVATRFSYDFGCYDGPFRDRDEVYQTLWYTAGREYGERDGTWAMRGGVDRADSLLIASEPLTGDVSRWLEVTEYTMIVASRDGDGLHVETRDLDV